MTLDMKMLSKLLMMTTSSHDNEALIAIRKANAMLASENMNWQEFLNRLPDNSYRVPPSQRAGERRNGFQQASSSDKKFTDAEEIDRYFNDAFANARGSFRDFLEDIHVWWQKYGFLTSKQYHALRKSATGG